MNLSHFDSYFVLWITFSKLHSDWPYLLGYNIFLVHYEYIISFSCWCRIWRRAAISTLKLYTMYPILYVKKKVAVEFHLRALWEWPCPFLQTAVSWQTNPRRKGYGRRQTVKIQINRWPITNLLVSQYPAVEWLVSNTTASPLRFPSIAVASI